MDKGKGKKMNDDTVTEHEDDIQSSAKKMDDDTVTEDEDDIQRSARKMGDSSTRKRKRAVGMEDYKGRTRRMAEKVSRSTPEKGGGSDVKTRGPVMGQFKISSKPCVKPRASISSKYKYKGKGRAAAKNEDAAGLDEFEQMPDTTNPPQPVVDPNIRQQQLQAMNITDCPPPDRWYAGVPRHNSQWTICIKPPKPTWYHPDWDAARRKKADIHKRDMVQKGNQILKSDLDAGWYRNRKTKVPLVTKHTVMWWQCHYYQGRQSWAFNISLEGYD